MMSNFKNQVYQKTVLNGKSRNDFVDLFSILDEFMDYRDTPMFQEDTDMIGGRLPKVDKKIVGESVFSDAVLKLSDDFENTIESKLA